MTLAVRQSSGTSPVASDLRNIIRRIGAMSSASFYSSRGTRLSGPGDLFGFRSFSSFVIPFNVKTLQQQDISEPIFYGDLVYKFKRIVGKPSDWDCVAAV